MEELRTFLAANISAGILGELQQIENQLKEELHDIQLDIKWIPASNIHLTLKFFGTIPKEVIPAIERELTRILASEDPVPLMIKGIGVFPNAQRPRILWAQVHNDDGRLSVIRERIEAAMSELGFAPKEKEFRPHLTLGRVQFKKTTEGLKEKLARFEDAEIGGCTVRDLYLYRSDLKPSGSEYHLLTAIPFGRSAPKRA